MTCRLLYFYAPRGKQVSCLFRLSGFWKPVSSGTQGASSAVSSLLGPSAAQLSTWALQQGLCYGSQQQASAPLAAV